MKPLRLLFSVTLSLAIISALAYAQDVKTDYDHHANFSQYHTYYWQKVKTTDPLWESRIQDAVNRELQSKGWQLVSSGGQVAITAVGSAQNQQEYETFYNGMGGWRWGGFGETTTQAVNYPVGSLVLDFYDAQNHQLIWRGVSSDSLSNSPEKNEKKLDKAVNKMLEHFPPNEKG
jgi:Domain of unknown function (DUF4136)